MVKHFLLAFVGFYHRAPFGSLVVGGGYETPIWGEDCAAFTTTMCNHPSKTKEDKRNEVVQIRGKQANLESLNLNAQHAVGMTPFDLAHSVSFEIEIYLDNLNFSAKK